MGETSAGYTKKNKTQKRKKRLWFVFGLFLLTMTCAFISYSYVTTERRTAEQIVMSIPEVSQVNFEVPFGANTDNIAVKLQNEGIIKYPMIFKAISKINGYGSLYKSGTHIISKDLNYEEIMIILSGKPVGTDEGKGQ